MGAGYNIKALAGEAEIYIYEDVGESWFGGVSAKQFSDDLRALGPVSVINTHINSCGGDVFDGLAIYRLLVDHKAKVISHIDGLAASIASVIAMAGDEIRITEAGFVMIHEAAGAICGGSDDMRRRADLLDTVTASICDVYAARTKSALTDIRAWMAAETWFTAADAVAKGFADTVEENLRVAARYDPTRHIFAHAPDQLKAIAAPVAPLAALQSPAPVAAVPLVVSNGGFDPAALKRRLDLQRATHAARTHSAA